MYGIVSWRESRGAPAVRTICGVRFYEVFVSRGAPLREKASARAAARTLARLGVTRAVFPEAYPCRVVFARRGVGPVSPVPLYRATAAAIARRALTQRGVPPDAATVAFAGERVSRELTAAVWALAAEVRYVTLAVGGCEALAHALRRERGVAARLVSPGETVRADLTVCFDEYAAEGCVLPLCDASLRVEYEPPGDVAAAGHASNALLAALYAAGALRAETLAVKSVELGNC